MAVCLSVGGQTVYQEGSPSSEALVATTEGVISLTRSAPGSAWHEASRTLHGKHISAMAIEPSRGVILAGTHGDGIYASEDGGRTWERRDRGIEHGDIYSLSSVQGADGPRLYAGTEPAHLYVSKDFGRSWDELPSVRSAPSVSKWTFPAPPHEAHVKHISFDPRSPDTIYASIEVGGALKSSDAGKTWRELSGFYEDVHRVEIAAKRPDALYITGGDGIYHSRDAGETWEHLTDTTARIAYPDALLIHPNDPDLVFTAGAICSPGQWRQTHSADARIGRSRDAGRTWTYLEGGLPEHIRGNIEAMAMDVWPGGYALLAGTTDGDVFFSEDEGESWSTIAAGLPAVSKGGHYRNLVAAGAH